MADTIAVALIVAGGTALGALVGATAGGMVDLAVERATESRHAMVAARLVRADLAVAASQLKNAEDDGRWWIFFDTSMEGWAAYREPLSARLSNSDFETVSQAVMELHRLSADMQQAPTVSDTSFRDVSASADAFRVMRTNATNAYNALAHMAKGNQSVGLLHA